MPEMPTQNLSTHQSSNMEPPWRRRLSHSTAPPPSFTTPPPLRTITPTTTTTKRPFSASSSAAAADPRKMQIVPSSLAAGEFELPDGWVVEVRPRAPGSSVKADKGMSGAFDFNMRETFVLPYYHEPKTGRQFRSLLSIKRYLYGEEEVKPLRKRPSSAGSCKSSLNALQGIVSGGKIWDMEELELACRTDTKAIVPSMQQHSLSSMIPDGWIVEQVPRKDGVRIDRYFIEPVKKIRFRFILEAQRYLAGEDQCQRKSDSREKSMKIKTLKDSRVDVKTPTLKIKWVFNGSREETWSPFVGETSIPDHVKELWAETFLLEMTGRKNPAPLLTMNKTGSE